MLHSSRVYFWVYAAILVLASAAIWLLGPQVSLHEKFVLASATNRLLCISLVILIAEIIRLQPRNIRDTTSFDPKVRAELSLLRNSLAGALKFLRKTKINVDDHKESMVKRPWHLLIGPENSGKTALMANSGFKFILSRKNAGKTSKGTRHVDWWVTKEAIVLDTSGNFTCHGTGPVYKKCWFTFLNWLHRHGNVAPMQSVIIALSLGDLVQQTPAEKKQIFESLHARLNEIQRTLKHGFQIHIIFTKCDMLAGFNAFFETLDAHEREQVWGLVLPKKFKKPFVDHVQNAWQQFITKLQERTLWRMHHERNVQKRAQIKDFPLQMEKAYSIIMDLVNHLPAINDADKKDRYSLHLSGLFFTSTSQKEEAFDQLLAPLTQSFALATIDESIIVNPELNYFSQRLFADVIFEGAKVMQWKKEIAFQQGLRYGMYAAATGFVVFGTLTLVQNFQHQLNEIDQAKQAMTEYQLLAKQAQSEPSLKSLLPALDALDRAQRAVGNAPKNLIKDVNAKHRELPELMQRSYDTTVVSTIIPKLKSDVEQLLERMISQPLNDQVGYFYRTFKVYKMLGEPKHADADAVEQWLAQFWYENNIGNQKQLSQLKPHITKALAKLNKPIALNPHLTQQAKLKLNKLSESELAQAILDDSTAQQHFAPLQLPITLTETENSIFHGPITTIPHLYTHQGFFNVFAPNYQKAAAEAVTGNWIIGAKLPPQDLQNHLAALEQKLATDYAKNYIQHWQTLLDNTRFVRFYSLAQAEKALKNVSQQHSALTTITQTIQAHTRFNQLDNPTDTVKSAAKQIHQHFRAVNDRLDHQSASSLEQAFAQLQHAMMVIVRSADEVDASFQFAKMQFSAQHPLMNQIQANMEALPDPMLPWFDTFIHDFWQTTLNQTALYLQQQYQNVVWKEYEKRIADRYPVSAKSRKTLSTTEFSQFYGPNGRLAEFFKNAIKPFVSLHEKPEHVRWKTVANQQIPLSDQTLQILEQLENVQKQFFHGDNHSMEINFSLIASALSPTIKEFTIKLDGHLLEYPNGATSLGNVRWPNPRVRRHDVMVSMKTDQDIEKKIKETGPWALFKFLDQAEIEATKNPKKYILTISVDKHALKYELVADSEFNPFSQKIFAQLQLPNEI